MAEHPICNREVGGSIPSSGTTPASFNGRTPEFGSGNGGSIPPAGAKMSPVQVQTHSHPNVSSKLLKKENVPFRKRDFLLVGLGKSIAQIMVETCEKYDVSLLELVSYRRSRPLVLYRQEAMYRCVKETAQSLPMIGRAFNRDHTTILHGVKAHAERVGV